MSLAPLVHPAIRGVSGRPRQVDTTCAAPNCISLSQECHHMWARSFLRGEPYEWVSLPSGRIVSNRLGVCTRHHRELTGGVGGHGAMIRLEPDETFIWLTAHGQDWINQGALFPQPFRDPSGETEEHGHPPHAPHPNLAEGETCPSCGYTRPTKRDALPKRPTKEWTALVPDDAEIGGDILDEWIEQFAVVLGMEGDVSLRLVRYHVLSSVLAWAMINRQQFIEDIAEVASS